LSKAIFSKNGLQKKIKMEKIRTFIAIDIPVSQKIKEVLSEIKKTGINAKFVEPENIHLTLKFLGDTDQSLINKIIEAIEKSVENISPFEIKFKNIGVFPNLHYIKVVWLGVENIEILKQIAENIDEKLNKIGFKKEKREFSAHLTVARVRSAMNKEKLIKLLYKYQEVEFQKLTVNKIIFKKSQLTQKGPIYTNIGEISIGEK
jgi:2'-5' RNA ligase